LSLGCEKSYTKPFFTLRINFKEVTIRILFSYPKRSNLKEKVIGKTPIVIGN
jgi:hypothetical protein